jgi:NAD(P)H-nitrite reductase large subunit
MGKESSNKAIVILGNGVSGITAARHLRKNSALPITVISEESPYFFSRTALMYVYMGHLKFEHTQPYENTFWEQNNIELVQKRVNQLDAEKQLLHFEDGSSLSYDRLVLACGSKPNKLGWLGEDLKAVQGLYHKKDLDSLEAWTDSTQSATVVGGGLIGIELAEMLHSRGKKVHFLVRESSFWNTVLPAEESELINSHIRSHGIELHLSTELESIHGDANDRVAQVQTSKGATLPCEWVGLAVGVSPNIDFLKGSGLDLGKGIRVNRFLETNLPNIYAVGDCAEQLEPLPGRQAVESVWYTGRIMGETLAQTLTSVKTSYQPGPWFNSAKFFDIEYQTYGQVSPSPDSKKEAQVFWQHPHKNCSLRLSFDPQNLYFKGIVSLGIRLRHEYFDRWLCKPTLMNEVVKALGQSFFDPEFSPTYQAEIQSKWELKKSSFALNQ